MLYCITLLSNHVLLPSTSNQAHLLPVTIDNNLYPPGLPPLLALGLLNLVLQEGPLLVSLPTTFILLLFKLKMLPLFLLTQLLLPFIQVPSSLSFSNLPISPLRLRHVLLNHLQLPSLPPFLILLKLPSFPRFLFLLSLPSLHKMYPSPLRQLPIRLLILLMLICPHLLLQTLLHPLLNFVDIILSPFGLNPRPSILMML